MKKFAYKNDKDVSRLHLLQCVLDISIQFTFNYNEKMFLLME